MDFWTIALLECYCFLQWIAVNLSNCFRRKCAVELSACSFTLSSPGLVCNRQCSLSCVRYPWVRAGCSQKGCPCPHRCIAGVSLALALVFTWSSGGLGHGVKGQQKKLSAGLAPLQAQGTWGRALEWAAGELWLQLVSGSSEQRWETAAL